MTDFLELILEASKDKHLIAEVSSINFDTLKKQTPDDNEDYVFGCDYKRGAFITDPNYNTIYKKETPYLFGFLRAWHNL